MTSRVWVIDTPKFGPYLTKDCVSRSRGGFLWRRFNSS